MKKILIVILSIFAIGINCFAEDEKTDDKTTKNIFLEIRKKDLCPSTPFRSPFHITIEALYNVEYHNLSIIYEGEADGEVFVYLGESLVGYSNEINSTILLPGISGTYTIDVISGSWTAHGAIELKR